VAMRFADVITSPSDDLADFVARDMNYPRDDIHIVRNPIDPDAFSPEGECALKNDGRKIVLFVGRLEERKGIGYLVKAIPEVLKSYNNARFVIIGDDTVNAADKQTSVLAQIKQSLKDNHCLEAVEFINRVPLAALPTYYRSADICVVPSVYDNSPYTCLESMSCGRAVIGTSAGGTREYMIDGESGIIVPPRDEKALADAMISLLSDDGERQRIATNARKRVLEKFQRKEIARQTVELYQLAAERFKQTKPLYLKDHQECLSDAGLLMMSFDKMLYDLLYQQSTEFRVKHWAKLGRNRPRLLTAKAVVAAAKTINRTISRDPKPLPGLLGRLEQETLARQHAEFEFGQ
ncbi:MAG TPA: glycosyltransferase family 4 protein, partial [Chroococcales cyanobacterium]